jgi:hypothetical protein
MARTKADPIAAKLSENRGRGSEKSKPHGFHHEHVAVAAYFICEKAGCPDGQVVFLIRKRGQTHGRRGKGQRC